MPDKSKKDPCWKSFVNKTKNELDILLHDEIGFWGTQSKDFVELLNKNKDKDVNVDINGPGGSVRDGFAIFNALKAHPKNIDIKITGMAASMHSVVAMASTKKPRMYSNTMMMIHKPLIFNGGNADDHREMVEVLDKLQSQGITAYKRHSTESSEKLNDMMNSTTYMTAEEAASFGLATVIEEDVEISNFHDLSAYNYAEIPEHVLNRYKNADKPDEKTLIEKLTDKIENILKPNEKESELMADNNKEYTDKIEGLETSNKTLVADNKKLQESFDTLETENKALKTDADNKESEAVTAELKKFVDTLVSDGKVLPVEVDQTMEALEALHVADKISWSDSKKDTPLVDVQKKILENSAKKVDLDGKQIADNSDDHQKSGDEALEKAVAAYQKENKDVGYSAALLQVLKDNPELNEGE